MPAPAAIADPRPDLGLQAHFWAPRSPSHAAGADAAPAASLVRTPNNSANVAKKSCTKTLCPAARFVEGWCQSHGHVHWVLAPCKKRACSICGPVTRYKIARRIALGVRVLWPAAWIVLTFAQDVDKRTAVRRLAAFVKWIRKQPGHAGNQYAATYELTDRGRLHINLIIAPWVSIPQAELERQWGARVWIEWVKDDQVVAIEAAAAYSPEGLGGYLAKLEQAVKTGKRVTYSKRWPKLPDPPPTKGDIKWTYLKPSDEDRVRELLEMGLLEEIAPGEYQLALSNRSSPACDCFHLQPDLPFPGEPSPAARSP